MGIFRTHKNFLNYSVTKICGQAIEHVLERDRDILLP